jgi:hypothetical protein
MSRTTAMCKNKLPSGKEIYEKPLMTIYGDLRTITLTVNVSGQPDGGNPTNTNMSAG